MVNGSRDPEATHTFYAANAERLAEFYDGAEPTYLAHLRTLLRDAGDRVLDVGAGSGRDVGSLIASGHGAVGVDASPEMVAAGRRRYGLSETQLLVGSLPALSGITERFAAVLCAAVLQHLPDSQLLDALYRLRSLLLPGGFLVISVPVEYPVDGNSRDANGRLMIVRPPEQYQFFLERLGLRQILSYGQQDSLGREGIAWRVLLFTAGPSEDLRPIEVVESILWDDRKVNSYKFALVRAIAYLATHRPNLARWIGDGRVSIPIDAVADLWIRYYWPLMESSRTAAVLQGPQGSKADMAFRSELTSLVRHCENQGGYAAFRIDSEAGRLSPESHRLRLSTRAKVVEAIKQPITYAGNDRTGKRLFAYHQGRIVLPAEIWNESALLGRWIEDSVLIRWAEFTSDLKHQDPEVNPGVVMALLLTDYEGERDTQLARLAYESHLKRDRLVCVWTGQPLSRFDVDHAIPWALWRNNDLWNLLPADRKANNAKRARIPARDRVEANRGAIVHSWEILYEAHPRLFLNHANALIGRGGHGEFTNRAQTELFGTFKDVLEYTAVNRGAERW